MWVVTGRLYANLAFGLPPAELPARLLGWATWAVRQFQPWGLALALAGLWRLDRLARGWWLATLLVWLTFTVYAIGYNTTDSFTYLIPASAVMALWLAEALHAAFAWAGSRRFLLAGLTGLAAVLLFGAGLLRGWPEQNLQR